MPVPRLFTAAIDGAGAMGSSSSRLPVDYGVVRQVVAIDINCPQCPARAGESCVKAGCRPAGIRPR